MRGILTLRKSTRIWLGILAVGAGAYLILTHTAGGAGCFGAFALGLAIIACLVLLARGAIALSRIIVRRTALRLAFSYFLIGIVPVPLLAALFLLGSYIVAHQFMATRVRREVTAVGESAAAAQSLPRITADASGRVLSSDVAWIKPGEAAAWIGTLARPAFLGANRQVWLAVPERGAKAVRLLRLDDARSPWLQELANRTGYEVSASLEVATRSEKGIRLGTSKDDNDRVVRVNEKTDADAPARRPADAPAPGRGAWNGEWIRAYYLETVANAPPSEGGEDQDVAILKARSSPHNVEEQLFAQGVREIGKALRIGFIVVAILLLVVYLGALAVAFVLAGSIARNVNRLTRAANAVSRGDYSVRIQSRSRDQIGDLTRSFDGMAASIERSVQETVRRQKVDAEIAMARTIQQKLLPPPEAELPAFSVHAHSEPADEIGGDYYDYMEAPGGRTLAALGDVSGHGLPTGLLVGMAKAGLATLVEAGYRDGELFARLNELIHRSTDPRHYMTLALLEYDPASRRGRLTNAGQLAPYRISGGRVTALELPALPLGLFPAKSFPTAEYELAPGDRIVFLTDGLVEAVDGSDEAFGFERLEDMLRANAAADAPTLRSAIVDAVRAHAGDRPLEDDCTLLILTIRDVPPLASS